jgi:di/tricarboxylate transporter
MVSGILTTEEALSGFSNPAVLTIAGLFVVGGAVLTDGACGDNRPAHSNGGRNRRAQVDSGPDGSSGAAVQLHERHRERSPCLLPAVIILARSAKIAPSRLLIPLAFGSLLGGASTLIGTPPNIIVSDLLRSEGDGSRLRFFSFTPMGWC